VEPRAGINTGHLPTQPIPFASLRLVWPDPAAAEQLLPPPFALLSTVLAAPPVSNSSPRFIASALTAPGTVTNSIATLHCYSGRRRHHHARDVINRRRGSGRASDALCLPFPCSPLVTSI
jgi:hypothetical protein